MARSTRSAFSSNSVPGIGLKAPSTRAQCSVVTRPFLPEKRVVVTAKSRSAPSSWLDEVRILRGQSGQVRSLFSFTGGCGMISSCVTESAPCRTDVPMQSEPVSPPPMTTTCFAVARIGSATSVFSPETRRFCCGRKSMAKWMPLRSRPSMARSRGFSAPPDRSTASYSSTSCLPGMAVADVDAVVEDHAFRLHLADAALDEVLLHLEVRDAVAQQAAGTRVLLVDVDLVPDARELLGRRKAGRTGADDRDPLASLVLGGLRNDPALLPAAVGDGALDRLDGDG
jgi:hypothetical protein